MTDGGARPAGAARIGWAGGVAVALAIGVLLAGVGRSRVVGSPTVDGFGTQWFFWFASEVVAGREVPAWTGLLFHPWGKDLYAHTGGNLVDALLAVPLRAALGPTLGFDAWVALLLASNAWAGARLAAAIGAPRGLRWMAGLALVLNPYVLAEIDLGRPTQAWLAPSALALAGLARMRTAREGAATGAALALTGLAYWYYGLLLGAVAVLVGAWRLVTGPREARGDLFRAQLSAAGVATLGVLPAALPLLRALDAAAVPGLLALDGDGPLAPLALRTVEGDAQGLYVVAPLAATAGSLLAEGGLRFVPGIPALSAVHLALAGIGVGTVLARAPARRALGWVPLALLGALFVASGPVLVLGDALLPNRAWIALVEASEVLRRWWWPGRAVAVAHLLIAALLPLAWNALPVRLGVRVAAGLALVAGVLLPLRRDGLLPLASWDADVPPTLACLAAAPPGGVIDVPLLVDQKNLWFQTVHRKPILGGMLLKKPAFAPPQLAALRAEDPLVRALDLVGAHAYTRVLPDVAPSDRARLVALGYRYVLARVDAFARPRTDGEGRTTWVSEWSRPRRQLVGLLGEPAAEDASLALWTLDGAAPDCVR